MEASVNGTFRAVQAEKPTLTTCRGRRPTILLDRGARDLELVESIGKTRHINSDAV